MCNDTQSLYLVKHLMNSYSSHKLKNRVTELQIDLLINTKHQQLKTLKYNENAGKNLYHLNSWIDNVRPLLSMFSETQHILKDCSMVSKYDYSTFAANQSLFILIKLSWRMTNTIPSQDMFTSFICRIKTIYLWCPWR